MDGRDRNSQPGHVGRPLYFTQSSIIFHAAERQVRPERLVLRRPAQRPQCRVYRRLEGGQTRLLAC